MQKYPLEWPVGYPRTTRPSRSAFKNPTLGKTIDNILQEIKRLTGRWKTGIVISTNIPLKNDGLPRADYMRSVISDRGAAVYFKRGEAEVVICCDKWDTVESNLHAIYKSIEALRSVERWGVSDFIERAFTGFKALHSSPPAKPWFEVMEFKFPSPTIEHHKSRYRALARKLHPDSPGGSLEKFQELQAAYEEGNRYFGV